MSHFSRAILAFTFLALAGEVARSQRGGPAPKSGGPDKLLADLKSPDVGTRRAAVTALELFARRPVWRGAPPDSPLLPHAAATMVALADRLKDEDEAVRTGAAKLLARKFWIPQGDVSHRIGAPAPNLNENQKAACLASLLVALKSSDPLVRAAAAGAVVWVSRDGKVVLPPLAVLLEDAGVSVRLAAVEALRQVEPKSAALPALRQALGDKEARVRTSAIDGIGALGTSATEAIGQVIAALKDTDPSARTSAAQTVGLIGERKESIPALTAALLDRSIRGTVATSLGRYRAQASGAIPALGVAYSDTPAGDILNAMFDIDADAEASRKALRHALRHPTGAIQLAAVRICRELGNTKGEVPALLDICNDGGNVARGDALFALFAIEPDGKGASETLIKALKEGPSGKVWDTAVEICERRGVRAKTVFPTLLDVYSKTKTGYQRGVVIGLLFAVAPNADEPRTLLMTILKDPPDPKRDTPTPKEWRSKYGNLREALGVCQELGPKAKFAVAELVALHANSEDEQTRKAIKRAVSEIDPEAAKKLGK